MLRVLLSLAVVVAAGLASFGCSSTDAAAAAAPPGPPAMSMTDQNGVVAEGGCAGAGYAARVTVGGMEYASFKPILTNIFLRPPGGCAGAAQCGQLQIAVSFNDSAATMTTSKVATAHVDAVVPLGATTMHVVVTALNDSAGTMLDAAGKPLVATADATLVDPSDALCTTPPG